MPDSVTPPPAMQPGDADIDRHAPAQRRELASITLGMLTVISVGGVFGTLARYGLGVAFPHGATGFPGATFAVNVAGCGLIGVLMACLDQLRAHRLVRPFLGVGVLGGFTTFSTYVVEVQEAVTVGVPYLALAYLGGTLAAAVAAVWAGSALASTVIRVLTRAGWHGPKER